MHIYKTKTPFFFYAGGGGDPGSAFAFIKCGFVRLCGLHLLIVTLPVRCDLRQVLLTSALLWNSPILCICLLCYDPIENMSLILSIVTYLSSLLKGHELGA